MALWQNFYEIQAFEPEILVGMYDSWLACVGFGPTQADRVLHHTNVMEVADERRFAMSQSGGDMSTFEQEHSLRIRYTIDFYCDTFAKHQSTEEGSSRQRKEISLLGLCSTTPLMDEPRGPPELDISGVAIGVDDTATDHVIPRPHENAPGRLSTGHTAGADESDDNVLLDSTRDRIPADNRSDVDVSQETMDAIHKACKASRQPPSGTHPRRFGSVRLRRPCHTNGIHYAGILKVKTAT